MSLQLEIRQLTPDEAGFSDTDLADFLTHDRAWREAHLIGEHDIFALPQKRVVLRPHALDEFGSELDPDMRRCTLAEADDYVQTYEKELQRLRRLGAIAIPRSTTFVIPSDHTNFGIAMFYRAVEMVANPRPLTVKPGALDPSLPAHNPVITSVMDVLTRYYSEPAVGDWYVDDIGPSQWSQGGALMD